MSFVIWNGIDCKIFSSKKAGEAWSYVMDNKSISEEWDGWVNSKVSTNHVAVINQFDTRMPYADAPSYLQPKEQL